MFQARTEIIITGKVQNVGYRFNSKKMADELGLVGYVCNQNNFQVKIAIEGEKENIEQFIDWCKNGPRHAIVENINVNWKKPQGEFYDFQIKY